MRKFRNVKTYHGSDAVQNGKLRGATDTDYFYFLCPKCPGQKVLRILDYENRQEQANNPYNEECGSPKAALGFVLAFKLYCIECGFKDYTKIGNLGWQGGELQFQVTPSPSDSVGQQNTDG